MGRKNRAVQRVRRRDPFAFSAVRRRSSASSRSQKSGVSGTGGLRNLEGMACLDFDGGAEQLAQVASGTGETQAGRVWAEVEDHCRF